MRLEPEKRTPTDDDMEHYADIVMAEVALLDEMENALLAGNDPRVLELARKLVGIEQQVRG